MDLARIPVTSIMHDDVVSATERTTVREAGELLLKHKIAGLPVIDGANRLIGVVSEKELVVLAAGADLDAPITYCHSPKVTRGKTPLKEVLIEIVQRKAKWLPVIDDNRKLLGVIARRDILKVLMAKKQTQ